MFNYKYYSNVGITGKVRKIKRNFGKRRYSQNNFIIFLNDFLLQRLKPLSANFLYFKTNQFYF